MINAIVFTLAQPSTRAGRKSLSVAFPNVGTLSRDSNEWRNVYILYEATIIKQKMRVVTSAGEFGRLVTKCLKILSGKCDSILDDMDEEADRKSRQGKFQEGGFSRDIFVLNKYL